MVKLQVKPKYTHRSGLRIIRYKATEGFELDQYLSEANVSLSNLQNNF